MSARVSSWYYRVPTLRPRFSIPAGRGQQEGDGDSQISGLGNSREGRKVLGISCPVPLLPGILVAPSITRDPTSWVL